MVWHSKLMPCRPDFRLRNTVTNICNCGKIPKYGVPDRIEIVKSIPRMSVGNTNMVELRIFYN
jgi:non-ribosomal peptide synthetase component E (peptide arylation enzyme)